jgi:arsenite methyltransferase
VTRDLLHADEIRGFVRDAYRAAGGRVTAVAERFYDDDELEGVPREAVEGALGVGNHLRHARIAASDRVLDIGCGAGIDTIIAARRAASVVALDFLPEMLERTAAAARAAGLDNVTTVEGTMEAIPLPDESVDVVVSNGVLNLSPRKARALAECRRVLRPRGELCVSDLTLDPEELPPEILTHPSAWAG